MLELKKYSQVDKKWASVFLGKSTLTIGDYGCLLTDLSSVLCELGHPINPIALNQLLIDRGGFGGDSHGEYNWGALPKIFSDVSERYVRTAHKLTDAEMSDIRASIDAGNPVVILIDYNPRTVKNDMHWVTIVAYNPDDENDFTVLDPIDGEFRSLKKYLGFFMPSARRTIEAYVVYSSTNCSSLSELQTQISQLNAKLDAIKKILQ
jgi:hypothetical protein